MGYNLLISKTLKAPQRPSQLNVNAQWLAGEGAGSWFLIKPLLSNTWIIERYSPTGDLECSSEFKETSIVAFDIHLGFEFVHISHCQSVSILQNRLIHQFKRISEESLTF